MGFMITSEISKTYLREEDAVEGFREAVENGQVRLALQILVDIIDVFEMVIAAAVGDEDDSDEVTVSEPIAELPKEATQQIVEPLKEQVVEEAKSEVEEKKTVAKKSTAKEEIKANEGE